MYDKSQLMKGTLEGCILQILSETVTYGYEIVTTLTEYLSITRTIGKERDDFFRTTTIAAWTKKKVLFING